MIELRGRAPMWVYQDGSPTAPPIILLHGIGATAASELASRVRGAE